MKLWVISQNANSGYDTYDSAVVAAETEEQARRVDPDGGGREWSDEHDAWLFVYADGRKERDVRDDWANHVDQVSVELIGEAVPGTEAGVVLASFNAG